MRIVSTPPKDKFQGKTFATSRYTQELSTAHEDKGSHWPKRQPLSQFKQQEAPTKKSRDSFSKYKFEAKYKTEKKNR